MRCKGPPVRLKAVEDPLERLEGLVAPHRGVALQHDVVTRALALVRSPSPSSAGNRDRRNDSP